jgi:hypothetical protein
MKYWLKNLSCNLGFDTSFHMTVEEMKKYNQDNKAFPTLVQMNHNPGKSDLVAKDIIAPKTAIEIEEENAVILFDNNIFEKLSVNKRTHTVTLRNSRIENVDATGALRLEISNVDMMSELTTGPLTYHLKNKDAARLENLNISDFDILWSAEIENAPMLKSSDSVEVIRIPRKDNSDLIVLKKEGEYLFKDKRGSKEDILSSFENEINNAHEDIVSLDEQKKEALYDLVELQQNRKLFLLLP